MLLSKKSFFVLNGPKGYRRAQKSPKWSKTTMLTISDPFGPLWNVDKPALSGHFCLFYWCVFRDTLLIPISDLSLDGISADLGSFDYLGDLDD